MVTKNKKKKAIVEDCQDMRLFPRYHVRNSSALMLMPGNIVSHSLIDVSQSGLSFCYYGKTIESRVLKEAVVTLFAENTISSDIPVQVISDTPINTDRLSCPLGKEISKISWLRRCSVKFSFISKKNEGLLVNILNSL